MISIVIPLYNKEKSIVSTIESVLAQSYADWELIIVDDGSTDGSADVVRDFIRANDGMSRAEALNEPLSLNDGKIRLISQDNAGVSAARNAGIMAAKGEYVAFLDGDDIWDKDFLKEMVVLINEYPGKSIYGLGIACIRGNQIPKYEGGNYYRGDIHWDWTVVVPSGSSACVRRQDAIEVGMFDTRMTHGEDMDMWWRLVLKNGGACYSKPYAYYRLDAENRAMHRVVPLEKHIPYYIDKYSADRAANAQFRKYCDENMVYRLYPYLFDKRYKKEARKISRKLDYSQMKCSMHFRMCFPKLYNFLQKHK